MAIENGRFDLLREKIKYSEYLKTMTDWDRGIHDNYDLDKG